jgi:hypothetical protein
MFRKLCSCFGPRPSQNVQHQKPAVTQTGVKDSSTAVILFEETELSTCANRVQELSEDVSSVRIVPLVQATIAQTHRNSDTHSSSSQGTATPVSFAIPTGLDKAQSELKFLSAELNENYNIFLNENQQFIGMDDEFHRAIDAADIGKNTRYSETVIERIESVFRVHNRKDAVLQTKWYAKVGRLLGALYPVAQLSIRFAGAAGEVYPVWDLTCRAVDFIP